MKHHEAFSLDDVIAAYLQELDDGRTRDPEEFVSRWPNHRDAFLRFIAQTNRVQGLTSDAIEGASRMDPSVAGIRTPASNVVGRFKLGRLIGRGGMSRVYEATDLANGDPVALKLLDSGRMLDSSVQTRFRREAQAVQSLDHPHIVALLAYASYDGVPYLAFPLIRGCTLDQLVTAFSNQENAGHCRPTAVDSIGDADNPDVESNDERDLASNDETVPGIDVRRQSEVSDDEKDAVDVSSSALECFAASRRHDDRYRDIAELMATAADTLHAAHGQGIVHRDVKPSNLMIDHNGHLWLTDFGLASIDDAQTILTQTGQVVGTPYYMSPEQAGGNSKVVDHRSDLFSLGATLYELATLQRPYRGDRFRVLLDISSGRLTSPSRVRGDIPQPLEAIILKAMSLEPADRYDSGADMAADLRRFAAGRQPLAHVPGFADQAVRWFVRNPRTSVATTVGIAAVALLVFALQYASGNRLARVNTRLSAANTALEQTNEELERSNANLDHSRSRLRRHLYVADLATAYRAYARNEIDSVRQLLVRQKPVSESDAKAEDLRGFEWWLLSNLTRAPEVVQFDGHDGPARELAVIPGRRQWVSVGDDGVIRHWDLEAEQQDHHFPIGGRLDAIAVSPDGRRLVTGINGSFDLNPVAIRNVLTGEIMHGLTRHGHSVESAAFSPDGDLVATADRYHNVHLHDAEGRLLGRVATDSRNESLGFSGDGKHLIAILREQVKGQKKQSLAVWTVPDLEPAGTWDHWSLAEIFALSADGRRIVVAHPGGIFLMSWPGRQTICEHRDVRGRIRCVALDAGGNQMVAGCDNGLIYVWRIDQDSPAKAISPLTIVTGEKRVTCVKFVDNETIVATSEDGSVRAWLLHKVNRAMRSFGFSTCAISAPSGAEDLLFLRGEHGGVERLKLSDLNDYRQIAHVVPDEQHRLAATADGDRVVAASPGSLVVLSGEDGSELHRIETGLSDKVCMRLQFVRDDGHLLALYADRLRVYHTDHWSLQHEVMLQDEGAESLAISPDESAVLVVTRNALVWLDASTLEVGRRYRGRLGEFSHARYTSDGKTITVGHADGSIELLSAADLQRIGLLRGHRGEVYDSLFLEQDSKLVTTADDQTIRFWDVTSGRELGVLPVGEKPTRSLHYSAQEECLYGFGDYRESVVWSAAH